MTTLTFVVTGTPVPQGSKSLGRYGQMYDANPALKDWREHVTHACRQAARKRGGKVIGGPIRVNLAFHLPRPAYHYGTGRNAGQVKPRYRHVLPTAKPDADKLIRAILDSITDARTVWADDAQVVTIVATKAWAVGKPHVVVAVSEVASREEVPA